MWSEQQIPTQSHDAHFDASNAAGQRPDHVILVAIIDTKLREGGPQQYRIDTPVPLPHVVKVLVHRVVQCFRIVEEEVVRVYLWLYVRGLGPLQSRSLCPRTPMTLSQIQVVLRNKGVSTEIVQAAAVCDMPARE